MTDKFMTNYQQNIVYYVVTDTEDEVYMKFTNHTDAIYYYEQMKYAYQNTDREFYLTQVKHTVMITSNEDADLKLNADTVCWFD